VQSEYISFNDRGIKSLFLPRMEIQHASFLKSSTNLAQCPKEGRAEFAFIGRSNVGKSSLINMLCQRKNLAKTSSKPGKTQMINHFEVDDHWYIVDLPGYGWSKVSKSKKADWGRMIEEYLTARESLACLFVLVDGRLEPQKIDYDFLQWLGEQAIPFVIVFTKTDKLSKNKVQANIAKHVKKLKKTWDPIPHYLVTSSEKGWGREEMLAYIGEVLRTFEGNND